MRTEAYGPDLAHVHDAGGLVVDLGCGSGVWARALTDAGYDVLGVEISTAMLALARRRAPAARWVNASLLRFEPPPCDAVTSLGECVNYLFDEPAGGMEDLARMFRRVHAALRPGGLFVLELAQPRRAPRSQARRGHHEGADWAIHFEVEEDAGTRTLTRRMTTFRRCGDAGLYRRSEEVHRQRLYETAEIVAALTGAGFRVRTLRRIGSHRLAPAHAAFVATRL